MYQTVSNKNVLRMFEAHFMKDIRMSILDEKNHNSYKRKLILDAPIEKASVYRDCSRKIILGN